MTHVHHWDYQSRDRLIIRSNALFTTVRQAFGAKENLSNKFFKTY